MMIRKVIQRMHRALWLAIVVGCLIPGRADEDQAAPPALTDVLKLERTTAIDRRDALAALRKTPLVSARWQSGFVSLNEEWLPFEAAAYTGRLADLQAEYLRLRSQAENSAAGHWELSKWCRANGLEQEEAAHALACICLSPEADHRETLHRLGFELIGGIWISPEELRQWATEYQCTRDSLKRWGDKVRLVAEQLKLKGRRLQARVSPPTSNGNDPRTAGDRRSPAARAGTSSAGCVRPR